MKDIPTMMDITTFGTWHRDSIKKCDVWILDGYRYEEYKRINGDILTIKGFVYDKQMELIKSTRQVYNNILGEKQLIECEYNGGM